MFEIQGQIPRPVVGPKWDVTVVSAPLGRPIKIWPAFPLPCGNRFNRWEPPPCLKTALERRGVTFHKIPHRHLNPHSPKGSRPA